MRENAPAFGKNFKHAKVVKRLGNCMIDGRDFGGVAYYKAPYSIIESLANDGLINNGDAQNSSPTIGQFLEMLNKIKDHVHFIGYVVDKKRSDARLSVEGFVVNGLTEKALEKLKKKFRANESFQHGNDQWRFWWD